MSRLDTFAFGALFGGAFILCYFGVRTVFMKHHCCCPGDPEGAASLGV
jgi:hypothetical protein